MRKHAPHLAHWVTRLWKTRPPDLENAATPTDIPKDLGYFFDMISDDYLPYLEANAQAVARGEDQVRYAVQDTHWQIPTAPYRAQCLNELRRCYAALDGTAQATVNERLSERAVSLLQASGTQIGQAHGTLGRLGRPAGNFG